MIATILGSIPSPGISEFNIGPLVVHIYGITMGIAVAAAYIITVHRYGRLGGDPEVAERAGMWAIVLGFTVARFAFVSSRLGNYSDDWLGIFRIWEGGIAMFGGFAGGLLGALWAVKRSKGDFAMFADSVALGLPAAQAIGRLGNYFNQELFGTPSNLPWAVRIDLAEQPQWVREQFPGASTFHPTFLYEILWSLATIVVLLWVERRGWLKRRGDVLLSYFVAYGTIRFLLEFMRTDTDWRLVGLSRNGWVSMLVVIGSLIALSIREQWFRRADTPEEQPDTGESMEEEEEAAAGEV